MQFSLKGKKQANSDRRCSLLRVFFIYIKFPYYSASLNVAMIPIAVPPNVNTNINGTTNV